MSKQCSRKLPIALFVVWYASAIALTFFNKCKTLFLGKNLTDSHYYNISLAVTLLATALYFLPMLLLIHRQAKAASLKWLVIVSRAFIIAFSISLFIMIIASIVVLLKTMLA